MRNIPGASSWSESCFWQKRALEATCKEVRRKVQERERNVVMYANVPLMTPTYPNHSNAEARVAEVPHSTIDT